MGSASFISECPNTKYLFIPNTVTNVNQLDDDLLRGSGVEYLVFTKSVGFGELEKKVKSTSCLGLQANCTIEDSSGTTYKYDVSSNTLTKSGRFNVQDDLKTLRAIRVGKTPNLKLGKLSNFSQDHVKYCISNKIPFIVVYHDSKTSASSRLFYDKAFRDSEFKKQLSELMCPIFMLDRQGNPKSSDVQWYKSKLKNAVTQRVPSSGYDKGKVSSLNLTDYFCCLTFFYVSGSGLEVYQTSTILSTDVFSEFKKGYDACHFENFDYSQYYVYEPPDESLITSTIDASQLVGFITKIPWWINSGSADYTSDFEFDKNLDFRYIASKEKTYAFVCSFDQRYGGDGSWGCKFLTDIFEQYADTVEVIRDEDTYDGMFCEKLKKGLQYKKFLFYEFSHGNTGEITIDHNTEIGDSVTKEEIWNVLKNARNVIFGIFESCYSGSMIVKTAKLMSASSSKNRKEDSLIDFLVKKFNEQKQQRAKSRLLGASLQEPMILFWSSAPTNQSSYYLPRLLVDGVHYYGGMSEAISQSYNDKSNYLMNYGDFFETMNNYGTYKDGNQYQLENHYQQAEYGISQNTFRITL